MEDLVPTLQPGGEAGREVQNVAQHAEGPSLRWTSEQERESAGNETNSLTRFERGDDEVTNPYTSESELEQRFSPFTDSRPRARWNRNQNSLPVASNGSGRAFTELLDSARPPPPHHTVSANNGQRIVPLAQFHFDSPSSPYLLQHLAQDEMREQPDFNDESSDAWTDDSLFMPDHAQRRTERDYRRQHAREQSRLQQQRLALGLVNYHIDIQEETAMLNANSPTRSTNLNLPSFECSPRPSRFTRSGPTPMLNTDSAGGRGAKMSGPERVQVGMAVLPHEDTSKHMECGLELELANHQSSDADDEDSEA